MYSEELLDGKVDKGIRILIGDFSIIWNLYEKYVINKFKDKIKNYKDIRNNDIFQEDIHECMITEYRNNNFLYSSNHKEIVDNSFNMLRKYIEEKCIEYNKKFNSYTIINYFNIVVMKAKKEVYNLFDSNIEIDNWDSYSKLHLLLIVMYRVRNNMFHGTKIITKLENERELFIICNNIMLLLLGPIDHIIYIIN